jgi:hypothetical protein
MGMFGDDLREQREGKTEEGKREERWRFHGETLRRNNPDTWHKVKLKSTRIWAFEVVYFYCVTKVDMIKGRKNERRNNTNSQRRKKRAEEEGCGGEDNEMRVELPLRG